MAFIPALPLSARAPAPLLSGRRAGAHREAAARRPVGRNATLMVTDALADAAESDPSSSTAATAMFSASGMTVEDFFERSLGEWRSQRSSHNLAWTQFEQITSEIVIETLSLSDSRVGELCTANEVEQSDLLLAFRMSWEGESDWDEEVSEGESVMAVLKDTPTSGRLLRSVGYAETVPAVGQWHMTADGVFVLQTAYEAAAAEERIWFATPHLRMRVSQIRTSSGSGVVTASLSTEIRRLQV